MRRACVAVALSATFAATAFTTFHLLDTRGEYPSSPGPQAEAPAAMPERHARFGALAPSADTRRVADWVTGTADNGALPFLIIDKREAAIYVFDAGGSAEAVAPVLLGIARGDRFAPGSAEKDMRDTSAAERITPAGRFVTQPGLDDEGHHVVWIQYEAGIALHAVLDKAGERRRQRLASVTPDDNRISFGCINLPTAFYRDVVRPLAERTRAVVYVLPDRGDALALFADSREGRIAATE